MEALLLQDDAGRLALTDDSGVELAAVYCWLAHWRVFHSGHVGRIQARTNRERHGRLGNLLAPAGDPHPWGVAR